MHRRLVEKGIVMLNVDLVEDQMFNYIIFLYVFLCILRYYYKSHVFEPVLGRRLVYKFGYNATNWKPINLNLVAAQKLYSGP
jgi:hypothetical protein